MGHRVTPDYGVRGRYGYRGARLEEDASADGLLEGIMDGLAL